VLFELNGRFIIFNALYFINTLFIIHHVSLWILPFT